MNAAQSEAIAQANAYLNNAALPLYNSPMTIYVQPKTVYGEQRIYPACAKSEQFAAIAGQTTLTPNTIKAIKALGYQIEIVHAIVKL